MNKNIATPTKVYSNADWYQEGHIYDDDGEGAEIYSLFGGNGDWYICLRSIDMCGNFQNGSFRISLSGTQIKPEVREKLIELCKLIYKE